MVAMRRSGTVVSCEKEEAEPFCGQCGEQKASFQYQFLLRENSCLSKVRLVFVFFMKFTCVKKLFMHSAHKRSLCQCLLMTSHDKLL